MSWVLQQQKQQQQQQQIHYENMPIQIYWKFYHHKNEHFQIKNSDIFIFLLKT